MSALVPYKSTPVFDENALPAGLRKEHRTKMGVWGVIKVLEGRLRYTVLDPMSETILDPDHSGLVLPDQPHRVDLVGAVRLQVEFYDRHPLGELQLELPLHRWRRLPQKSWSTASIPHCVSTSLTSQARQR